MFYHDQKKSTSSCKLPHASAGEGGNAPEPALLSEGRCNNVGLVTEPELLHFGIDYIRLCLGVKENYQCESLASLSALFLLPHNDSNAANYKNRQWLQTTEVVDLTFGKTVHGEACYVYWHGWPILALEKISPDSSLFQNIHGKYQFVVSLYGDFFASQKLGLDIKNFLSLFHEDIQEGLMTHAVTRLDIATDWSVLTVSDISSGIQVLSPSHAKVYSGLNKNWETGIPETFYYGKSGDKRWYARIYNKKKDIEAKGKEALYPHYSKYETVTRLELELREVCKEFSINFLNCWDEEFLLSVMKSLLDTKYVQWSIMPLLIRKMSEKGYGYFNAERVYADFTEMKKQKFYRHTMKKNLACINRYRMPVDEYLKHMSKDITEEMRILSRQAQ